MNNLNPKQFEELKTKFFTALDEMSDDVMVIDPESSSIFLSFMDEMNINALYDELSKKTHILKAMELRLEHYFEYKLDKASLVTLLDISDGAIGRAILLLYYIQRIIMVKKIEPDRPDNTYSLDKLIQIFDNGFPTTETMHTCWEKLKIDSKKEFGLTFGSDNLMDYFSFKSQINEESGN